MIGKLAIVVSVVLSVLLPASSASADPYSPSTNVDCLIKVGSAKAGEPVVIEVAAHANGAVPKGTITVRINRGKNGNGATLWTESIRYTGQARTIIGPELGRGPHLVSTSFVPDDGSVFAGCEGSLPLDVSRAPGDDDGGDDGDDDNNGLLPDTGGPAMLWLVLGLGLVGGGAVLVARARRRTPATA